MDSTTALSRTGAGDKYAELAGVELGRTAERLVLQNARRQRVWRVQKADI